MAKNNNLYPNQRIITVNKAKCDKEHLYTMNNLDAIDEAAFNLQSKGGFKLYLYLAKNQDKYNFALSSRDFIEWSGLSRTAYRTAFQELEAYGYLIKDDFCDNIYTFYDTPCFVPKEAVIESVQILYPKPLEYDFNF